MDDGRILVHGAPREVLTSAWISRVYGVDVSVVPHPASGCPVVLLPPATTTQPGPIVAQEPDFIPTERAAMAEATP